MIKKKRLFNKPKKAFESFRIKEENELVKKYGLKNKKEIWKTLARVNYFRKRAMTLANASKEEQEVLFGKLIGLGLKVKNTADVLDLKAEDLMERRLPTVLFKKKMAKTTKQARQLVVHKKVLINGNAVNTPSYLVSLAEEDVISLKEQKPKKPKPVEPTPTETPAETPAEDQPTETQESSQAEPPTSDQIDNKVEEKQDA